jgi:hypothetical protein
MTRRDIWLRCCDRTAIGCTGQRFERIRARCSVVQKRRVECWLDQLSKITTTFQTATQRSCNNSSWVGRTTRHCKSLISTKIECSDSIASIVLPTTSAGLDQRQEVDEDSPNKTLISFELSPTSRPYSHRYSALCSSLAIDLELTVKTIDGSFAHTQNRF